MSSFRTESGLSDIAAIRYRTADDDLIDIAAGRGRNAANALKTFFSAMSAAASPEIVTAYGNDAAPVDITTAAVSVTVTGGVAPYTYLWTRTDVDADTWTIADGEAASTSFTCVGAELGIHSASFICTVTDASGGTAASNGVSARATNLGGGS